MAEPNVTIELILENQKLMRSLNYTLQEMREKMQSFSKQAQGKGFLSMFSNIGNIVTGIRNFAGILSDISRSMMNIGKSAIGLGTRFVQASDDVERAGWKFNIVFSRTEGIATRTAASIAEAYGRHISTIQTSMSRIGDILKPAGVGEEQAMRMAAALTELTQNAKEWTDGQYDARTAAIAMAKALVGEREMLKEMGIIIREQDVTGYIEAMGWAYNEANKQAATFNLILQRSIDMQRAAGTRMGSFAEAIQQTREAFKGMAAALGEALAPVWKAVTSLARTVMDKVTEMTGERGFGAFRKALEGIAQRINRVSNLIAGIDPSKFFSQLTAMVKRTFSFVWDMWESLERRLTAALPALGAKFGRAIAMGIQAGMGRGRTFRDIENTIAAGFGIRRRGEETPRIAAEFGDIFNRFTEDLKQITGGRVGRRSQALGRPFAAKPMEELSKRSDKLAEEIKLLEKGIKEQQKNLIKSRADEQKLRVDLTKLRTAPQDREATLKGLTDSYRDMLTAFAGQEAPDQRIADKTEEIAQEGKTQSRLMREIANYQRQLVDLQRKRKEQATFGR